MEVAVPELRRYAPDMLRVLGIPIGLSDEVADTLVWSEAAIGGAVRFVQVNRPRLFWTPRPRLRVLTEDDLESVIDARGGSLLEFGARIIDYAVARARNLGSATVHVDQTYGEIFIPYLRHLAEYRGMRVEIAAFNTADRTGRITFVATPIGEGAGSPEVAGWRRAYQKSVASGLDMTQEDFTTVTELFEMLRVPTSERSRTHAG